MPDAPDSHPSSSTSDTTYGIVMVTASSQDEALHLAEDLVQAGLAACVSLMPICSIYTWKGEVHRDSEWQLLIKTDLARFSELETRITALHSYDVPEIIAIPILQGSHPYLQWMHEQVHR